MNNKEIRELIIMYADKGLKYSQISKILLEKHGIEKSRQSVHGIHKRALMKNEEKYQDNQGIEPEVINDILNLYVRGYNRTATTEIIQNIHKDSNLNYYIVRDIVNNNEELGINIWKRLVFFATEQINSGKNRRKEDLGEVRNTLGYKGIEITDRAFNELLKEVISTIIVNETTNKLTEYYKATRFNNDLIKDIIEKIGMGEIIDIQTIKERASE